MIRGKYAWSGDEGNRRAAPVEDGLIASYTWEDMPEKIKIRFPAQVSLSPTSLDWTATSVRLEFGCPVHSAFEINPLEMPISEAKVSLTKRGVPLLELTKVTATPWSSLIDTQSPRSRSISSDDAESTQQSEQIDSLFGSGSPDEVAEEDMDGQDEGNINTGHRVNDTESAGCSSLRTDNLATP